MPAREEVVKERLGKFDSVLTAGFHLLIPFIDRIAYRQERREQVVEFQARLETVDDRLAQLHEFERKVRIIANLPGSAGAGGTEVTVNPGDAELTGVAGLEEPLDADRRIGAASSGRDSYRFRAGIYSRRGYFIRRLRRW